MIYNRLIIGILGVILLLSQSLYCQEKSEFDFERIEDNSFLLEEAYNQEPGVIQHISAFQYMKNKTWAYSFTDEWPVPGQKHQLSVTLPVLKIEKTGIGDILLNYRYQALMTDRFALSPRFSFILPTGSYKNGMGYGTLGYQINIPASLILNRHIVTHYNAGITLIPSGKQPNGDKVNVNTYNYGFSSIFLISTNINFMIEFAGTTTTYKPEQQPRTTTKTFFINPGVRYALNFKSGLQIVPGLAVPIGIGPSAGENGFFLYLSFEHPFWKPKM